MRQKPRRKRDASHSPSPSTAPTSRTQDTKPRPAAPTANADQPALSDLGLCRELLAGTRDAGYRTATPIQAAAIPVILSGRDLIACAQTGTGKTAAFALPVLQRLSSPETRRPRLRGLVLTPTRELATQVRASLATYGRHLRTRHTAIFGGVPPRAQITQLRKGVDILVATPGRLLDLVRQQAVRLDQIETVVLDEADRMLDMGFLPDIRRILALTPRERQTLMFSATMPKEIRKLADGVLRDPAHVAVTPVSSTANRVEQRFEMVNRTEKRQVLLRILRDPDTSSALVFSRTKHGANRLVRFLDASGVSAEAIHGNKSQGARMRSLQSFRDGRVAVLVATDIAARGIDVEGISHVINFEVPDVPETYVHRIGRTGRAGARGVAVSLCDPSEVLHVRRIERLVGARLLQPRPQTSAEKHPAPTPPKNRRARPPRRAPRRRSA